MALAPWNPVNSRPPTATATPLYSKQNCLNIGPQSSVALAKTGFEHTDSHGDVEQNSSVLKRFRLEWNRMPLSDISIRVKCSEGPCM